MFPSSVLSPWTSGFQGNEETWKVQKTLKRKPVDCSNSSGKEAQIRTFIIWLSLWRVNYQNFKSRSHASARKEKLISQWEGWINRIHQSKVSISSILPEGLLAVTAVGEGSIIFFSGMIIDNSLLLQYITSYHIQAENSNHSDGLWKRDPSK